MLKSIKKMVLNRLPSGTTFQSLKKAITLHKLYPENSLIRGEFHYWLMVYFFTGKVTHYLGIDQKRFNNYLKLCQLQLVETEFSDNVMSYFYEIIVGDKYYGKVPSELSGLFADMGDGPYEIDTVQIHAGDVVIDAGANVGIFSLLAAKKGADKIYAFEPQERILGYLHKNILILLIVFQSACQITLEILLLLNHGAAWVQHMLQEGGSIIFYRRMPQPPTQYNALH